MLNKFLCFIFFLLSYNKVLAAQSSVLDIISKNSNLSEFHHYILSSGLDNILKKKLPWDWTVFAPNNEAFNKFKKENSLLENKNFAKNLMMDHIMIGNFSSDNLNESTLIEKTVSNKSLSLSLYRKEEIYVKDMVVIEKDINASNGIVHSIGCIMYVQESETDSRLSKEIKEKYPITSCCMQDEKEITAWKASLRAR
tara:strand:- start:59 stop:649 length:591 start_codon:yes stop_codon:yes gene_type:complete